MKHILIPLTHGKFAMIDPEYAPLITPHKWHISKRGYARRARKKSDGPGSPAIWMHKVILGITNGKMGDHINRDKLDNRRSNLRNVTPSQSQANRGTLSTNTSGYRGVSYDSAKRGTKKWCAQICAQYQRKRLGCYQTPQEAAIAYDSAAKELFGEYAVTNF